MPGSWRQAGRWPGRGMRWRGRKRSRWQTISCCRCRWTLARTPLAEPLRAARPGALALGGMLSEEAKVIAAEAGVELVDYFAREELAIRNAIPTAEGCIGVLLAQRKRTLWGSAVLLLGFGPVGQAVGTRLAALGAHVTVAARRPAQRAQAESLGMQGRAARLARLAPAFDTVVNTIPAQVLTAPVLARLRPGSLIVDLASRPGGRILMPPPAAATRPSMH